VWTARKRNTDPGACPQFSFTKEQRRVSAFYIYIFDEQMGPGFIKICSYFPYPVKVWVNGHEWAKRQALAAGLPFTALSNGFSSCADPAALQAICDRFGPGTVACRCGSRAVVSAGQRRSLGTPPEGLTSSELRRRCCGSAIPLQRLRHRVSLFHRSPPPMLASVVETLGAL